MLKSRKRLASLVLAAVAVVALPAGPAAAAVGGSGIGTTIVGTRFVTGGANYAITPTVNSTTVTVEFECHAVAAPDASQTRVRSTVEDGCVLWKGTTPVAEASGQSLPGPAAATTRSVNVSLDTPGVFRVCWRVAATYILNGGSELNHVGCTNVNA